MVPSSRRRSAGAGDVLASAAAIKRIPVQMICKLYATIGCLAGFGDAVIRKRRRSLRGLARMQLTEHVLELLENVHYHTCRINRP